MIPKEELETAMTILDNLEVGVSTKFSKELMSITVMYEPEDFLEKLKNKKDVPSYLTAQIV